MVSSEEVYQLARVAVTKGEADVRLLLAKYVRKLRKTDQELSGKLEKLLKSKPSRANGVLRKGSQDIDAEGGSISTAHGSLLKAISPEKTIEQPIWEENIVREINQIVAERNAMDLLLRKELRPTRSMIFKGPPGVGKTMTAKWLAQELNLPFYMLDLTTVMSSYLGKTGSNLRRAIDYAKSEPCLLLLDEVDAIAKRRDDEGDVGELKRLVTVMLQELEDWPDQGILVAATNHSDLVDPALWRRFDIVLEFGAPSASHISECIRRYLGDDASDLSDMTGVLELALKDKSYSDIERTVMQLRRFYAIDPVNYLDSVGELLLSSASLARSDRIEIAVRLVSVMGYSKHKASKITGVSRDTIRKKI